MVKNVKSTFDLLNPKTKLTIDFDSYCLQIFALRARVDPFGFDGSEFLIGFGPLQNPTPQIGYPIGDVIDRTTINACINARTDWYCTGDALVPSRAC